MSVCQSGVWTGTEAVGAFGLPEGGGDPVLHRGRPGQTTTEESVFVWSPTGDKTR